MLFRFVRVPPFCISLKYSGVFVDVKMPKMDAHNTLKGVELWAERQPLGEVTGVVPAFRGERVAVSAGIAEPQQNTSCLMEPNRLNQLLAEQTHGIGIQEQHAPALKLDGARVIIGFEEIE